MNAILLDAAFLPFIVVGIAALVLAALFVIALIALAVFLIVRARKRKAQE